MGASGQFHTSAALPFGKEPGTRFMGWVSARRQTLVKIDTEYGNESSHYEYTLRK
jgi:hypothetical protein